jgi:hypothetical protein
MPTEVWLVGLHATLVRCDLSGGSEIGLLNSPRLVCRAFVEGTVDTHTHTHTHPKDTDSLSLSQHSFWQQHLVGGAWLQAQNLTGQRSYDILQY